MNGLVPAMNMLRLVSFFGEHTSSVPFTAVMDESVKPLDIEIAGRKGESKWLYQTICTHDVSDARTICLRQGQWWYR